MVLYIEKNEELNKKILAVCLMMGMVMVMCMACQGKKETLKVGMEIGYPPFEYYDADGTTPIGVDVELATALVEELEGLKVGYQEETTSDTYLTDYITASGANIETYEYAKIIQVFDELELGRIDAIICDSTVAFSYVGEGSIYEITWQQMDEAEEFGVCIQKGNTELVDKVNAALETLKSNGKLDEILAKYF